MLMGIAVCGGISLYQRAMPSIGDLTSPCASFFSVEKEWTNFVLHISQTHSLVNLDVAELIGQKGKPFYYLLFVDGRFIAGSEETMPDTASLEGEKFFIWWYPTETCFNTQGVHWLQIKHDKVISELYVYEPIDASQEVQREKIERLSLNTPWVYVLRALGIPQSIFVEVKESENAVFRLRYKDTGGDIFELAGDMEQVRYLNDLSDDSTMEDE